MRHVAGIGIVMLALAGCQSLPSVIRIEVDGTRFEFEKKVPPGPDAPAPDANGAADANGATDAPIG